MRDNSKAREVFNESTPFEARIEQFRAVGRRFAKRGRNHDNLADVVEIAIADLWVWWTRGKAQGQPVHYAWVHKLRWLIAGAKMQRTIFGRISERCIMQRATYGLDGPARLAFDSEPSPNQRDNIESFAKGDNPADIAQARLDLATARERWTEQQNRIADLALQGFTGRDIGKVMRIHPANVSHLRKRMRQRYNDMTQ